MAPAKIAELANEERALERMADELQKRGIRPKAEFGRTMAIAFRAFVNSNYPTRVIGSYQNTQQACRWLDREGRWDNLAERFKKCTTYRNVMATGKMYPKSKPSSRQIGPKSLPTKRQKAPKPRPNSASA